MATTTNSERASWGQAALDAAAQGLDAPAILLAYSAAKSGHQRLYEEPVLVASDALTDALHALQDTQLPDTVDTTLVSAEQLDLTAHQCLMDALHAKDHYPDAFLDAVQTWQEEQQEGIDWGYD